MLIVKNKKPGNTQLVLLVNEKEGYPPNGG